MGVFPEAQKVMVRGLSVSAPTMERDLVNFPQRQRPIERSPVRMGVFPEEWFTALYSKTGVSGPYMFLAGVGTFLCSKEYFVMEHDFYVGIGLACVLAGIVKQVGPDWTAMINKELDQEEADLRSIRQNEIDSCKAAIAQEEAVSLQLESVYRARLMEAHQQVKKRLDYQLETANVMRRMEQKHMVDWIISNVKKSITPALEDANVMR